MQDGNITPGKHFSLNKNSEEGKKKFILSWIAEICNSVRIYIYITNKLSLLNDFLNFCNVLI